MQAGSFKCIAELRVSAFYLFCEFAFDCLLQWIDASAGAWVREQQELCTPCSYARIFGQLRAYQGTRSITVHRIRPVEDMNEITYHMAAVMVSSIGETVARVPSFASPQQAAGGVKFEASRAGISSMPGGMGQGVSPAERYCSPTIHRTTSSPLLSPGPCSLLQIVKDRGDPSTGMSIADIASNCQMPRATVALLMEQLSNDGKARLPPRLPFAASPIVTHRRRFTALSTTSISLAPNPPHAPLSFFVKLQTLTTALPSSAPPPPPPQL